MQVGKKHSVLVVGSVAAALSLSGCENMNAGGWIGMLAGGAAGAYAGDAYLEPADGTGDGTMMLMGAVMGASLGMLLGSGAVTPGEMTTAMVQANENIRAEEQQKAAEAVGYRSAGATNTSSNVDAFDLASSEGNGADSIAQSRSNQQTGDVEVWCYATREEIKRFTEMVGGRSVERVEGIYHAYISPLSTVRINYGERYEDRFNTQWANYLAGRGISVSRSGCNIGSGQFDYHNSFEGPKNPLTRLSFVPQ